MDNNMEQLYMVMDESDAPFEEGECPYERTVKNDLIMLEIYKSMGLELKVDSDLAKLEKEIKREKRETNDACIGCCQAESFGELLGNNSAFKEWD